MKLTSCFLSPRLVLPLLQQITQTCYCFIQIKILQTHLIHTPKLKKPFLVPSFPNHLKPIAAKKSQEKAIKPTSLRCISAGETWIQLNCVSQFPKVASKCCGFQQISITELLYKYCKNGEVNDGTTIVKYSPKLGLNNKKRKLRLFLSGRQRWDWLNQFFLTKIYYFKKNYFIFEKIILIFYP